MSVIGLRPALSLVLGSCAVGSFAKDRKAPVGGSRNASDFDCGSNEVGDCEARSVNSDTTEETANYSIDFEG